MEVDLYLRVREKEGRLYSDDVLAQLPFVPNTHPLANEWRMRSASASRLTRYLARRSKHLSILELGCGNGWLSSQLSKAGHHVVGMDQNLHELKQAARVFPQNSKLVFMKADMFSAPFFPRTFDVIVLASVIQYFQDLPALLSLLMNYLKPDGEIHIIDSPLYEITEWESAVRRSKEYYLSIGFPEMADGYFHHLKSDLKMFNVKQLHNTNPFMLRLRHWLGQTNSPFPWLVIRKQNIE